MIISCSRRTDIPAFYSEWLLTRLRAGFCLVPNPMNSQQISRISLTPEDVDAIVFWTRNAGPLLAYLDELDARGYRYMFQYTLTNYPGLLEPRVPPWTAAVRTMEQLSRRLGPNLVIWRYDPILLSSRTGFRFHLDNFRSLAESLAGVVDRVIISLVDRYGKTARNLAPPARQGYQVDWEPQLLPEFPDFIRELVSIGASAGLTLNSCAEEVDLAPLGVRPGRCIDPDLIGQLLGHPVSRARDRAQRPACSCAASRDIGTYDTCGHGCLYCYATTSHTAAQNALGCHVSDSELLVSGGVGRKVGPG